MVDSNDQERIKEAAEVFSSLVNDPELKDAAILVFANKMDLPHAMSVPQISEALGLTKITDRKWYVQASSAPLGNGLYEGMDWLSRNYTKAQ